MVGGLAGSDAWRRDAVVPRPAAPMAAAGVSLRPLVVADYPSVYEWALSERNLSTYMFRGETPSPDSFVQHLWHGVGCQFIVSDDRDGRAAGMVTCYGESARHGHAKVAVCQGTDPYRATLRGLGLFVDYLFATFGFRKVYADVLESNLHQFGSGIGAYFEVEGRLVDHEFVNGDFEDLCLLAIHRDRWPTGQWAQRVVFPPASAAPGHDAGGDGASEVTFDDFVAVIREVFAGAISDDISPHRRFGELGLDSLAVAELLFAIDPDGELADDAIDAIETAGDAFHFYATLASRREPRGPERFGGHSPMKGKAT